MDKECIIQMLQHIRANKFLGPKTGDYPVGDRVVYALEKDLIKRSDTGNFTINKKGSELLEEKLNWESL
ncbi:MAG: hypothetical protein ACXVIY_10695 [Mucilaginibacter sp.]